MIVLENVRKSYSSHLVLDSINFEIKRGEFVSLFGPNGCGKSTLMNIICGLEQRDSGDMRGLQQIQGRIGFVFQDYRRSLLPWLNAYENIVFPLRLRGVRSALIARQFEEITSMVKTTFDFRQRVFTLSGGQAQTVALLRALIIRPELLILDEPFSALDFAATMFLRETLTDISTQLKLTTLFISHDLEEALFLGDRVLFLSPAPSQVLQELPLPWPRPRPQELLGSATFAAKKYTALEIVMGSETRRIRAGAI